MNKKMNNIKEAEYYGNFNLVSEYKSLNQEKQNLKTNHLNDNVLCVAGSRVLCTQPYN